MNDGKVSPCHAFHTADDSDAVVDGDIVGAHSRHR